MADYRSLVTILVTVVVAPFTTSSYSNGSSSQLCGHHYRTKYHEIFRKPGRSSCARGDCRPVSRTQRGIYRNGDGLFNIPNCYRTTNRQFLV